jgi:hypothetical protein
MYLKKQNATEALSVTKVSLLTGPAYFEDSKEGIKKIITTLLRYVVPSGGTFTTQALQISDRPDAMQIDWGDNEQPSYY